MAFSAGVLGLLEKGCFANIVEPSVGDGGRPRETTEEIPVVGGLPSQSRAPFILSGCAYVIDSACNIKVLFQQEDECIRGTKYSSPLREISAARGRCNVKIAYGGCFFAEIVPPSENPRYPLFFFFFLGRYPGLGV